MVGHFVRSTVQRGEAFDGKHHSVGSRASRRRDWGEHCGVESPADRAQFEVGDVIRAVNGKAVTGPQDWIKMISECEPGTKAELKVVRERKEWRVICDVAEAKRQ